MSMSPISSVTPSTLPDQYALIPGDGLMARTNAPTPGQTLDVDNLQHQRVLSVTDNPQANSVIVREYSPATGAQTGVNTYADGSVNTPYAKSVQQFHEISGSIPGIEGFGGVDGRPISQESLTVDGYRINIAAEAEPDHNWKVGPFDFPTFRATSALKDHVGVSVESDKAGTVTMNSVAGESGVSTSYSAPAKQGFDLLKPSTWLSGL